MIDSIFHPFMTYFPSIKCAIFKILILMLRSKYSYVEHFNKVNDTIALIYSFFSVVFNDMNLWIHFQWGFVFFLLSESIKLVVHNLAHIAAQPDRIHCIQSTESVSLLKASLSIGKNWDAKKYLPLPQILSWEPPNQMNRLWPIKFNKIFSHIGHRDWNFIFL